MGGQSSSDSFTVTDTRQFNENLNQTTTFDDSDSNASFGGTTSFSNQSEFDYLLQYTTRARTIRWSSTSSTASRRPASTRSRSSKSGPSDFFQHFFIPLSADLTVGEYSQPSGDGQPQSLATWRGDANLVVGPAEEKVLGSDFQGTVTIDQYAYGTGDLKAAIEQDFSLTTPISSHIVNTATYNEANYNGPALVPFQYLDQQPTMNTKNAQDLIRLFNDDVYAFSVGWTTNFDGMAQPLSYQLSARPVAPLGVAAQRLVHSRSGPGFRDDESSAFDAVRPRRIAAVRHEYQLERPGRNDRRQDHLLHSDDRQLLSAPGALQRVSSGGQCRLESAGISNANRGLQSAHHSKWCRRP